jgi:molybdate transport system permease protein
MSRGTGLSPFLVIRVHPATAFLVKIRCILPLNFDWSPLSLSLEVAAVAGLLAFVSGVAAALAMHRAHHVPGRDLLEALFLLPLVLPPVVTGYALLVLLGPHGALGSRLQLWLGLRMLFTPAAAVLASWVVAFPLMYQCAKAAFAAIDPSLEEVACALGARAIRTFWSVTVPLAWPGLVAGAVLAFARALGEFGATIMVAGNIAGRTTTTPTAIYEATMGGDLRSAGIYAALMAICNLLFVFFLNRWSRRLQRIRR